MMNDLKICHVTLNARGSVDLYKIAWNLKLRTARVTPFSQIGRTGPSALVITF